MNNTVDNSTLESLASPLLTVVLPIFYTLVFLISTPCNLVALFLLCFNAKRATPTVIYSINLCISDLLYSITLPLQVHYHVRGNDWNFSSVTCGVSTAAFYCNMSCSIVITCAIALERYCGIVRPLESRNMQSSRKAILTCFLIWAVGLAFQIPFFLYDFVLVVPQLNIKTCFDVLPKKAFSGSKGYLYFVSIYLLFYVLPLIVLVTCYCTVARALRQTLDAGVHRSYKRTQSVVIVAALSFIFCYLPNMIVQPLHMVFRSKQYSLYAYYKLTLGLISLHCCFDPFVYYFASSDLRQALWKVLGQWISCTRGQDAVTLELSEMPTTTNWNQNESRTLINQ